MGLNKYDNAELMEELESRGYILGYPFTYDDVQKGARTLGYSNLNNNEIEAVARRVKEDFDAEFGLCWDAIYDAINYVKEN